MAVDERGETSGTSAPLALLLGGLLAGLVRLSDWLFLSSWQWGPGAVDAAQCIAMGGLLGIASFLGSKLSPRLAWSLAPVGLALLGAFVLKDDVDNFSRRQTLVPRAVAFWTLTSLLPQGVALAWLLSRHLIRYRVAWGGPLFGFFVLCANDVALRGDYVGVHWIAGVMAIALFATPFAPALLARFSAWRWAGAGVFFFASCGGVFGQGTRAASALAAETGAAFAPFFPGFAPSYPSEVELADSPALSPWLVSRAELKPIPPSPGNPLPKDAIVVVISVDALRADVVNDKKYAKLLPNLTRLREEGIVFLNARAPGTLTKNSLSSLFLGTYFSQQYWSGMDNRNGALAVHRDPTPRFVEALTAAKVRTINFRPISWIRNGVMLRGVSEDIAIKYPKKKSYYAPSPPVFKKLLPRVKKMAKAKGKPFFLFSHLADPHAPYDQGRRKKGPQFKRYLSEVQLVDKHLGKLLELLQDEALSERVLLFLTADHGEAFGEHGAKTHGTNLYDEALRIPLILWRPGIDPEEHSELVSLIDLGPTILDAFRLDTPGFMMGQSLLPVLSGGQLELTRPIIAETRLKRALITENNLKLIVDVRKKRTELYDLNTDPAEEKNLATDRERVREPRAFMQRFFSAHQLKEVGGKPYTPPYVR